MKNNSIATQENNLAVQPKGSTMPARTLTPEAFNTQIIHLLHVLELKLSLKDNEQNTKNIIVLKEAIEKTAWGMSFAQILEAFNLYIDGMLSYNKKPLEPISGYLDTILFKKVISAYRVLKDHKTNLKTIAISVWNHWKENKNLKFSGVVETFDFLYDKEFLPKKGSSEKIDKAYSKKMISAQGLIYAPMLDKARWFENEDLADTPGYRDLLYEMQTVKDRTHPDVGPKFKELVLLGYFEKLKTDLSDVL